MSLVPVAGEDRPTALIVSPLTSPMPVAVPLAGLPLP